MEVELTKADISEEEELRKGLEALGRVHDCAEAGCTHDPEGRELSVGGKAAKRPKPSARLKQLWRKYREGELK